MSEIEPTRPPAPLPSPPATTQPQPKPVSPCDPPPPPRPPARPGPLPAEVSTETRDEIVRLKEQGYGARRIRDRVSLSRKVVTRVLEQEGLLEENTSSAASKLAPFVDLIAEKVKLRLTVSRILREIQEAGYQGGRTILADHVRPLRAKLALEAKKSVKRRFETDPGQEMQIDWSPYTIPIAGRLTKVHALGCILCASRKLHLRFYRDERQATLLEGLAIAFAYFDGVAHRVVLDNMATAVLGRIGADRKVIWHQRFAEFVAHHGFTPFACQVRDPDRKGKKEKSFRYLWDDFLKGSKFSSWEDLDRRCGAWLDQTPKVGNLRIHGTTRLVPNEEYQKELPLLIRLPEHRFPVHQEAIRVVDRDSTLSINGTRYTVPAPLAQKSVAVRLFAEHFEVLGPHGQIAFSRRYVADMDKGKLQIDPTHYASLPRGRGGDHGGGGDRLDEAFVRRFPGLVPFVEGLKRRMKALAPIHLRALLRLSDRYGEEAFLAAAYRALEYRRFDAPAVARILEKNNPLEPLDPIPPLGGAGPAVLGEVPPPSLDGYGQLDHSVSALPTCDDDTQVNIKHDTAHGTNDDSTEDDHGA